MHKTASTTEIQKYVECIYMFNKLHTKFYDIITSEISLYGDTDTSYMLPVLIYELGLSDEKTTVKGLLRNPWVSHSNISYSLDKLDKLKLITSETHKDDKRIRLVSLSQKGKIAFESIKESVRKYLSDLVYDVDTMHDMLSKMDKSYSNY